MKFENVIKKVSGFIAAFVVFFLTAGFYLSVKGFEMNENGELVLVNAANAAEEAPAPKVIPANYVMPQSHAIGEATAPVTIYEYSSFGCFHCADFHLNTLPKIKEKYIDNGQVRLVFVPFPIDRASMSATMLAECVPADKYFAFTELLFKKQREWGMSRDPEKVLKQYAALSGVPSEKAESCLKNDTVAQEILQARQDGITQLGIQGTPSFVISSAAGKELLSGAPTMDKLDEIFTQKLANN